MTSQSLSPADRIRDLSAINADVATMLQSAGRAINSLTNRPLNNSVDVDEDISMTGQSQSASIDDHKEAFTDHTKAYYTSLQAVVARLRRQAYALEEAGIIAAEAPTLTSSAQQQRQAGPPGRSQATPPVHELERITNGGLGNLDVGWLNSRGNKVGAEKESELMEEARKLLEGMVVRRSGDEDAEGT